MNVFYATICYSVGEAVVLAALDEWGQLNDDGHMGIICGTRRDMTAGQENDDTRGQQLEGLLSRLRDLDARYKETRKGLDALINDSIRSGENIAEVINVTSQLAQELDAANPSLLEGLYGVLGEICELYLRSNDAFRAEIRAAFERAASLLVHLLNLIAKASLEIPRGDAADWLKIGLVAASIEDNRTDFRDTYMALGGLYVAAARAGLEPVPYFRDIAALSSERMRQFLGSFDRSAFFAADVIPHLPEGTTRRPL